MSLNQERIDELCRELGLDIDCFSFQFLWFLPVIQVMWADGICQKEEIESLLHHLDRFVDLVKKDVPEITAEKARRFFMPLLDVSAKQDPFMRRSLNELVDLILADVLEPARRQKRLQLFELCLEVAESSRHSEAGPEEGSVSEGEERILRDLLRSLHLLEG